MKHYKAAIIGSGNLAFHLLPALCKSTAVSVICLHSRNEEGGLKICRINKIAYAKSLYSIPEDVSIIFMMTSDTAISEVSHSLTKILEKNKIIVHFSGTSNLSTIDSYFENTASAWPVQSISMNDMALDLSETPFCISSASGLVASIIQDIFSSISQRVVRINEDDKKVLHLAAVIANNFSNHLFDLAKKLVQDKGLSFDLLKAIILKTAENAVTYDPAEMQTGPAIRGDFNTMEEHIKLLEGSEEIRTIYEIMSKSINSN